MFAYNRCILNTIRLCFPPKIPRNIIMTAIQTTITNVPRDNTFLYGLDLDPERTESWDNLTTWNVNSQLSKLTHSIRINFSHLVNIHTRK